MKVYTSTLSLLLVLLVSSVATRINAQDKSPLIGRWDMVIQQEGKELPSWLEITKSGSATLVGRFVYAFGSSRPIAEVKVKNEVFSFVIPRQWEPGDKDMKFEGSLAGTTLSGTMVYSDGKKYKWTATPAKVAVYNEAIVWGAPKALFNGTSLNGWSAMGDNQWIVKDGILTSPKSGSNLVSDEKFLNFKLHVEFKYPAGSNSGIYLRGRHEVQIEDNIGLEPSNILFGGIYGFLTPNEMMAKPAGEWQSYDITLNGNRVSIIANGKAIITDQIIPGITGGALDSNEAEVGPLLIQGDHGPVEFRSIVVTPELK
ncbi:DUF1080 domain-containing protein [Cellulophaga sp. E16_2]|uniref:3-keto-disaccharide hydrolase n=1 Tax=unclassified Cellulophaga TaxID=2634405 RepID=UPI0013FDF5C0|nr:MULTISPECIES: DUF1080 domain-containing protein [unclassified Cellulophaga]MBO0589868.1 DUF1080 domain-containing protein [Cellulophaga sp. E16_2]